MATTDAWERSCGTWRGGTRWTTRSWRIGSLLWGAHPGTYTTAWHYSGGRCVGTSAVRGKRVTPWRKAELASSLPSWTGWC
eukprot:3106-Pyramimonas_sp.AAC.1